MAGEGMSNQLSNVLGVAIPYDLKRQLSIRSEKLGAENRTSNDIEYLANKSCWVRLVSSVRIKDIQYFKKYFPNLDITDGDSLAKKFILFAGTSEYTKNESKDKGFQYNIRSGFGANGSYGMLGNVETQLYGYRPMPGIIDARIETQGKLGSIRSATINFKVWDKAQLDVIDALYFKLGYTMFLEWGHTTYFDNGTGIVSATPQLKRSDLQQIDPFAKDLKKELILREISTRIDQSNGNYDAMLGMCTNFNFSMNEDGGYDCSIKMIALGELASQIKINQPNALPKILSSEIKVLVDIYNNILREKARQEALAAAAALPPPAPPTTPAITALTPQELFSVQEIANLFESGTRGLFGLLAGTNESAIEAALNAIVSAEIFRGVNNAIKSVTPYSSIQDLLNSELEYDDLGGLFGRTPSIGSPNIGKAINDLLSRIKQLSIKYDTFTDTTKTKQVKKGTIVISDTGVATPDPRPAPKAAANTPRTLDAAYKAGTYDTTVDQDIAKKFYESVSGPGTDPNALKLALQEIKDGAQYIRVRDIVKTTGTEKNSIVDWINSELGSSWLGDNTDDVKQIVIILNNRFKQKFASAEYESYTDRYTNITDPEYKYKNGTFKIDNEALNKAINVTAAPPPPATTTAASEEQPTSELDAATVQKDEQLQYQSGLEVFIRSIQLHSFNIGFTELGVNQGKIGVVNLYEKKTPFIKDLFSNGVLSKSAVEFVNSDKIKEYKDVSKETDAIKLMEKYASYGFNHNLMAQSKERQQTIITDKDSKIPQVNFKELYKSYVVPYSVNQGITKDIDINYPVYIKLGFLLLALNHMCTIYDSKEGLAPTAQDQTPLVYLDFNPETNFCLSDPLQMSTDPLKILIPFRGTNNEYSKLFDSKLIDNGKIMAPSGSTESKDLFKPQTEDFLSSQLPGYKDIHLDAGDAYSGKIMNILVSCDYILSLCKNFANNDASQSVKLRPFLQQIIDDINKYLGGINLLRLAYDDKSNCLYIVDDQIQPMKLDEKPIPDVGRVNSEIPVFGKYSIARSLEIRTDISSKLSNMIAISANSNIKSDASKDGTPFGHFNENYTDRFIPQVLSANTSDVTSKKPNDTEIAAATAFNEFVKCALNTGQISDSNVSAATNYYIERMNKRKGEYPGTRASAMIPLSVNFSTDGISGLAIGHAFLLPKEVLPASYERESDSSSDSVLGFVVTGLNHSLQNNTWITEVKANMMYLKDRRDFVAAEKTYNVKELSTGNFVIVPTNFGGGSGNVSAAAAANYKEAKISALSTNDENEAIFRWAVGTEGTILYIQWDIANWRTGHGSGTITLADSGKVINLDARKSQWPTGLDRTTGKLIYTDIGNDVENNGQGAPRFTNGKVWNPKMSGRSQAGIITRADADADLRRRIKEDFKPKTINTLKSRGIEWNSLPLAVKVAMVKACYGYGTVPNFMTDAYKSGGQSNLAAVLLAKSQVPGNSDYGAEAAAFLLS